MDFLNTLTTWIIGLIKAVIGFVFDLVADILIYVLDMLLSAVAALINLIPVPDFMGQGLGSIISQISPTIAYFGGALHLDLCFIPLGAAVVFRLSRKVLTLFQW